MVSEQVKVAVPSGEPLVGATQEKFKFCADVPEPVNVSVPAGAVKVAPTMAENAQALTVDVLVPLPADGVTAIELLAVWPWPTVGIVIGPGAGAYASAGATFAAGQFSVITWFTAAPAGLVGVAAQVAVPDCVALEDVQRKTSGLVAQVVSVQTEAAVGMLNPGLAVEQDTEVAPPLTPPTAVRVTFRF